MSEVDTFVVKDFDAVSTVVRDKNLLAIIYYNTIGKLQMLGTSKLVEDISSLVKNDHAHYFTLHNYDAAFIVHGNTSWVLENVGTKFAHKLTILVVNLDLKR